MSVSCAKFMQPAMFTAFCYLAQCRSFLFHETIVVNGELAANCNRFCYTRAAEFPVSHIQRATGAAGSECRVASLIFFRAPAGSCGRLEVSREGTSVIMSATLLSSEKDTVVVIVEMTASFKQGH